MSDEKKNNVFLDGIKNWLKKFGLIIAGVFGSILAFLLLKKVDHEVQVSDEKKKDKISDNLNEAKDNVGSVSEITTDVKEDVDNLKEDINVNQNKNDNEKTDYVSEQTNLAINAGFKKKTE